MTETETKVTITLTPAEARVVAAAVDNMAMEQSGPGGDAERLKIYKDLAEKILGAIQSPIAP